MMQQYRIKYPSNWEDMARACKQRAGWKCEECGVAQHTLATSKRGNPYIIYLAACHVNHDPDNAEPELKALCVACHARYDYQRRQREARIRVERMKHLKLLIERGAVVVRAYL